MQWWKLLNLLSPKLNFTVYFRILILGLHVLCVQNSFRSKIFPNLGPFATFTYSQGTKWGCVILSGHFFSHWKTSPDNLEKSQVNPGILTFYLSLAPLSDNPFLRSMLLTLKKASHFCLGFPLYYFLFYLSSHICKLWEEEGPIEGELQHVVPPDITIWNIWTNRRRATACSTTRYHHLKHVDQ